jgi:hypothetical protein
MCLNKTHTKGWVGRHLSGMFSVEKSLKQGDALPALLFNFALDYVNWRAHANQGDLKLNSAYQCLM